MRLVRCFGIGALLTGLLLLVPAGTNAGGLSFVGFEIDPPGLSVGNGLDDAIAVALSPNGLNVYTVGNRDDAITVWDRNPATNTITLLQVAENGVGGVDGMDQPQGVAVSPDGACVYVATKRSTVASFSRNLPFGYLNFVGFVENGVGGVDGIKGAIDVVVSPDSAHVYVAGEADNAVAVFSQIGCALTFIEAKVDGAGGVDGLRRPQKLAISADGLNVYTATSKLHGKNEVGTVVVLNRAPSGALTFVEFEQDGVAGVDGLVSRVEGLAVSPDGKNVYAASRSGDTIVAFTREIGGDLTYLETDRPTGLAKGFKGATGLAVSPDDAYVYVAGRHDDAIAVFARDPVTGELRFLEFQDDPVPGTDVLGGAEDVAVSPDGTGVYVVGYGPDTLVAFTADRCGNGIVGIDEQCDDGCLAGTANVCEPADDGDGCSATCKLELCGPTLITGSCHAATPLGGASLQIKHQLEDRKDQLKWNWKGQATTILEYGNPVTTATYVLCIYDGSGNPQPLLSRSAPFDGTGACNGKDCWSGKPTSYQYGDKFLTPDGVKKIQLKEGLVDDKPKIQVQGSGVFLRPPILPLTLPVTVQVRNTQNSECWEAVYNAADRNEAAQFKAKSN